VDGAFLGKVGRQWTTENRPRYNRDKLRYPSDLTNEVGDGPALICDVDDQGSTADWHNFRQERKLEGPGYAPLRVSTLKNGFLCSKVRKATSDLPKSKRY
jgi:hypothetical protein